jgi:hypothetical protein
MLFMRFVWVLLAFFGVWLLVSSFTPDGLLPGGHGTGRWSEALEGLAALGYAAYRLRSSFLSEGNNL